MTTEPHTGAEEYLAQRLEDPEYAAAYFQAQDRLDQQGVYRLLIFHDPGTHVPQVARGVFPTYKEALLAARDTLSVMSSVGEPQATTRGYTADKDDGGLITIWAVLVAPTERADAKRRQRKSLQGAFQSGVEESNSGG